MRAGAENYLIKPLDVNAVLVVLREGPREAPAAARAARRCGSACASATGCTGSSGEAPELQAVYEVVKQVAPTRATVLILGESGTGKELVARALHEESPQRADKPFVKVNCAALSETPARERAVRPREGGLHRRHRPQGGRFELADGGTLFLDEIGDIVARPPGEAAARAAGARVRAGGRDADRQGGRAAGRGDEPRPRRRGEGRRFREDLFYRLNVVAVTLPPLRRAQGRHPAWSSHFVEKYAASYGRTAGPRAGDAQGAPRPRLAGQRPRAGERRWSARWCCRRGRADRR